MPRRPKRTLKSRTDSWFGKVLVIVPDDVNKFPSIVYDGMKLKGIRRKK